MQRENQHYVNMSNRYIAVRTPWVPTRLCISRVLQRFNMMAGKWRATLKMNGFPLAVNLSSLGDYQEGVPMRESAFPSPDKPVCQGQENVRDWTTLGIQRGKMSLPFEATMVLLVSKAWALSLVHNSASLIIYKQNRYLHIQHENWYMPKLNIQASEEG